MAQVVENLLSKSEAQSTNPSTSPPKKKISYSYVTIKIKQKIGLYKKISSIEPSTEQLILLYRIILGKYPVSE
jgi:hypothetical protein